MGNITTGVTQVSFETVFFFFHGIKFYKKNASAFDRIDLSVSITHKKCLM